MARLTLAGVSGRNYIYDGKCNSAREKREARAIQNRHRKPSMDAYYRPRLRSLVDLANWDMENMEGDDMPCS
ncbi:MAG: hypothetical protein Q7U91_04650 [Sideroxyarcus sp.]|nr:hypothetical protein [Sideroxyarcus sp.]